MLVTHHPERKYKKWKFPRVPGCILPISPVFHMVRGGRVACLGGGGETEMSHLACHSPSCFRVEGRPQSPNLHSPGALPSHPGLPDCFRARQGTPIPAPYICCSPFPSLTTGQASSPALVPEPSRLPDTCICIRNPTFHTPLLPRPALSANPQPR